MRKLQKRTIAAAGLLGIPIAALFLVYGRPWGPRSSDDSPEPVQKENWRPTAHRLSRSEYANVIRDFLAVEIESEDFLPADNAAYGFDNNAGQLSITPGLLERYLSAAKRISELAVGNPKVQAKTTTYQISKTVRQNERMSDDLPFGSRGGLSVRHYFPLDGEYVARLRFRGTSPPQPVLVLLDDENIAPELMSPAPPVGEAANRDSWGSQQVRFKATAGTHTVGVTFVKSRVAIAAIGPTLLPVGQRARETEFLKLADVEIRGPTSTEKAVGDTPSRRKIFVCRPVTQQEEGPCARQILSTLARRAYRRPVTDADVETLLECYEAGRREGDFDAGIRQALQRMLVDVEFLFRIEGDTGGGTNTRKSRLTDLELASRLSFFLWSSIPDDQLLTIAEAGNLHSPAVLSQQVRRMLADKRATALARNFGEQWLYLRNLRIAEPNVNSFPEFDDNVRAALHRETQLFLEDQLRRDRPVTELLTTQYTFLNERLARYYGISNVYGAHFRRVNLRAAPGTRSGLLGQGSILTVTSHGNRTSPVVRGKWVLENILGEPPPPPPPNVPTLMESGTGGQPATMRELMALHIKDPVCASCHRRMDAIGLALENYNAVGMWRTRDAGKPIDASTILENKRVDGAAGLQEYLLHHKEQFRSNIVTKLLVYATGRGVGKKDAAAVREILTKSSEDDYRWSSIIVAIVESEPFQSPLSSAEGASL